MHKRKLHKIPFGKEIEANLINSLRMAGIRLKTGAELDHNHKIDFVLKLKNQDVGIQFSLMMDQIKAKVAKICALDVVPRFIYLTIAKEFFNHPDKKNGEDLYRFLDYVAERYSDKALSINIDHSGLEVNAL